MGIKDEGTELFKCDDVGADVGVKEIGSNLGSIVSNTRRRRLAAFVLD